MAKKKTSKKSKTKAAAPKAAKKDESITITKTTLWQIVSGVLAIAVIILLFVAFAGNGTTPQVPTQPGQQPQQPTGEIQVNLEGVRSIGDENAPVVIVEYSDFTCPFCKRFNDDTLVLIKQNYVDEGIVRFIYKDFPVVGGGTAAEAGWCVHEQGEFWAYHDIIFERQSQISESNLRAWAAELGLDTEQFNDCLSSGKYAQNVAAERQEAINNGMRGTPGFLVNGQPISGAQPYAAFEAAIQNALN